MCITPTPGRCSKVPTQLSVTTLSISWLAYFKQWKAGQLPSARVTWYLHCSPSLEPQCTHAQTNTIPAFRTSLTWDYVPACKAGMGPTLSSYSLASFWGKSQRFTLIEHWISLCHPTFTQLPTISGWQPRNWLLENYIMPWGLTLTTSATLWLHLPVVLVASREVCSLATCRWPAYTCSSPRELHMLSLDQSKHWQPTEMV